MYHHPLPSPHTTRTDVPPPPSLPAHNPPPQALPEFGPYLQEKEQRIAAYKKQINPAQERKPEVHRPPFKPTKPIPTVKVKNAS